MNLARWQVCAVISTCLQPLPKLGQKLNALGIHSAVQLANEKGYEAGKYAASSPLAHVLFAVVLLLGAKVEEVDG
jgi:hypothetical protein